MERNAIRFESNGKDSDLKILYKETINLQQTTWLHYGFLSEEQYTVAIILDESLK